MTTLFSTGDVCRILQAENIGAQASQAITQVAIDSRQCQPGTLFIGLRGQNTDGAAFFEQAMENGAIMAVFHMDSDPYKLLEIKKLAQHHKIALALVDNTLYALQKLAQVYVAQFSHLIKIAVTGSSGKTTVKELIAAILRQMGSTAANYGNLNSDSGLPLSCFQIGHEHRYAVLEMGMNRIGEMAELAKIFVPHYAAITNIGTAHVGLLGSQDQIAIEKKAIFSRFDGNQQAFIPQDDRYAAFLADGVKGKIHFYSLTTLNRLEKVQDMGIEGWVLTYHGQKIRLGLAGKHNLSNACLAIEICQTLGAKAEHIKQGLESIKALPGRGEILRGRITVYQDCYNANPQSMAAALQLMGQVSYNRKLAFLGEMRELGLESAKAHAELADKIIKSNLSAVFLLGVAMKDLEIALKHQGYTGQIFTALQFEPLVQNILDTVTDGDLLLLKGSRFWQLERLIPVLREQGWLWLDQLKEFVND
jgi:UDP-N-acetylmuramoyl-tripeptide--D-alanyl-D-alanine ligase